MGDVHDTSCEDILFGDKTAAFQHADYIRRIRLENSSIIMNCIQIDAAINPGNSGGALFNMWGQVIGITSSKLASSDYEGIGFAVSIDEAKPVIEELMEKGYVAGRVKIGVTYYAVSDTTAEIYGIKPGICIVSINPDCDVANTDLAEGDIITEIDGKSTAGEVDIASLFSGKQAGDEVACKVYRKTDSGDEKEFEIKFKLMADNGGLVAYSQAEEITKVDKKDLETGWDILKNEKYRGQIYMYDSERDSFMVALKSLGYSMNTTNKGQLQKAYSWLEKQRDIMKPVYVGDDVIDNMISGNKAMAVVYSGDGAYIISENENMSFFVPKQGSNVWTDAMVMTKSCKNADLAYKFMNYFLEKDVAKQNTAYIGYDSAVQSVYEYYRDEEYAGNPGCAPDTSNPKNEEFGYQKRDIKEYCAGLWTKIKSK